MDNQFGVVVKLITVVSEIFEGAQEPTSPVQRYIPQTENREHCLQQKTPKLLTSNQISNGWGSAH